MKATTTVGTLANELGLAVKVVSKKAVIPALAGVRLEATMGRLALATTDGELAIRASVAASVAEPGVVVVPAQRLYDLLRTWPPEADVTVESATRGASIAVRGFKAKLAGFTPDDFPTLPEEPAGEPVWLPRVGIVAAISRVRYATAEDDKRYFLGGARMELRDGTVRLVATDGHRLAIVDAVRPSGNGTGEPVILPRKALDALAALADATDGADAVAFRRDENRIFFSIGDRLLVSRTVDGKFPAYERIVPPPQTPAEVDRQLLQSAVRRATMVSEAGVQSNKVGLALAAAGLGVTGRSADIGEAEEPVPVTYSGKDVAAQVNGAYVLDFVDAVTSPTLSMEMKDADSALVWRSAEEGLACQYVVMPMR